MPAPPAPRRSSSLLTVGLYLGLVQLCFALTWTVYLIFLPRLAGQAGIAATWVSAILMLDQLVFTVCDWGAGVLADRAARWMSRLSRVIVIITVVSAAAFLLMPFAAPLGAWLFPALIAVWAVTSSALRAPPMVLIGKYAPTPAHPLMAAALLLGNGIAGAASPYLGVALRDADARLPFVLASVAMIATVIGMRWAERRLARNAPAELPVSTGVDLGSAVFFLVAVGLLAVAFQIHFFVNAAPGYLHFAKPPDLEFLMPLFWVGFNLMILPAAGVARRFGALAGAGIGAWVAAGAAWACNEALTLHGLVIAQLVAGAGWGCVLSSAVSGALAIGRPGREGLLTGSMFSLFALGTLTRVALVAAHVSARPELAAALRYVPAAAWLLAGILLLAGARRESAAK
jgi:hypothetical protein